MARILFYEPKEPYYEFSNFYDSPVTIFGKTYPTTEHYFQASKFTGPQASARDKEYADLIRTANTPNKAFYLARQSARGGYSAKWTLNKENKALLNDIVNEYKSLGVGIRGDWETVKDNVMRRAVWAKFGQHEKLRQLLIKTGDAYIIENSPRDSYWGIGSDGSGQNMLGRILMEVRALITGKFPAPPTEKSNWVIPEFLLASAYPGDSNPTKHSKIITELQNFVNVFVSLQEPFEERGYNSYRPLSIANPGHGFCERDPKNNTIFIRIPIKDRGVVSDAYLLEITKVLAKAIGKHYHLLVHCLGGKGRTGTVVAVLLGEIYGMTAAEALEVLEKSFATRKQKGRAAPKMPQTAVQFAQVKRILGARLPEKEPKLTKPVCKKGAIFHWGVYSVPAFDDIHSSRRRKLKNGSEWYQKRLLETGKYRPVSGYKETQAFHEKHYSDMKYIDFLRIFNEETQKWDPQTWFDLLKKANIKYAILTAKHHDGICLWNTQTTKLKTKRDLVKDFIETGRKNDISVGIYYSWTEFTANATIPYMNNVVEKQIKELVKYNPDIFWFDGDWELVTQFSKNKAQSIAQRLKDSGILVNSRLAQKTDDIGIASFKVFGDRTMPEFKPDFDWEYIFTIGTSWGLNLQQEDTDYLTGKQIFNLYKKTCNLGGSFLINFGPHPDGSLDKNEVESFTDFTRILNSDERSPTVTCIKKEVLKKAGYADLLDWLQDPRHVYIGRNMTFYVPGAAASKWKNPYPLKKYTLEKSLKLYEKHVRDSPELMASLPELADKVLGCWCEKGQCHGDVLVKLYNETV